MIDARMMGYVALGVVTYLIYQAWMTDYPPPAPVVTEPQAQVSDLPQPDFSAPEPTATTDTTTIEPSLRPEAVVPTSRQITVITDVLKLKIDSIGGTISHAELLEYPIELKAPEEKVILLNTDQLYYVAQSGLQDTTQTAPGHDTKYTIEAEEYQLADGDEQLVIPLNFTNASGLQVTKKFILQRGSYEINVVHEVQNNSDSMWQGRQYQRLQRAEDDGDNSYSITQPNSISYTGGVIYSPENHYEKIDFDEMADKPLKRKFSQGWLAMIQHYFLAAWLPEAEQEYEYYSGATGSENNRRYVLGMSGPVQSIAAGDSTKFKTRFYVGPKIQDELEELAKGLELTVDYGWLTVISKPLFILLNFIHDFTGNWGWSIIIVTLLIKALFYKLAETSYRSMANMRRVQPKMMAIKERYANDRQRQGQAMMELYKKEKINPLGGCLPMLIQIPVFIALYWVLLESVELRQAPFILWIQDLSSKDPYFVLPVVMGISMYIQQKLNPAPVDPVQAKVFMVLPFVFTVFFAFFPAGLVLYWVVNNVLTIAQQWVITRKVLNS